MTNFEKQMSEAITTYSKISGEEFSAVVATLKAKPEGTVSRIIKMLMVAAA